jgi:hypothetical protein
MEKRNAPALILNLSLMWLMAALFSARRLDAQAATATILGSVTDGSGAVVPGAAW